MKDIIIIGTGKGALLHLNSYKRIKRKGNIYFVDIVKKSKFLPDVTIYSSIQECISNNNLNVNNIIVDICTPASEFYNVLDVCKTLNIKNVLIEKPFVLNEVYYHKYKGLNIIMVQNYLYSKVTEFIKKYIDNNKKEINFIYTNFSKNRIVDSSMGRGFNDKVTLNYEIEIPHQIYITRYILNDPRTFSNNITCSRDMKIGDLYLKNHGYGLIISKIGNTLVMYESNLTSNIVQKRIIVCTKDNYSIEGNYAIYTKSLKMLKCPNVSIFKDGKRIKKINYKTDDNFTCFIKSAYNYFNKGKEVRSVNLDIFSKELNLYCENLLERKNNS